MIITTLIENKDNPDCNFFSEHGMSFYLENEKQKFLIDTGQSDKFLQNANQMNIDLSGVDYVIITHGHYDHINGLTDFLKINDKAKIIVSPHVFENDFYSFKNNLMRYVGKGFPKSLISQDRFIFVNLDTDITESLSILTNITIKFPTPIANKLLIKRNNGLNKEDDFNHEIIPCLKIQNEIVVITGCAHTGILNILEKVHNTFFPAKIKMVIGGFHLPDFDSVNQFETEKELLFIGKMLAEKYVDAVFYTGHCTGRHSIKVLQTVLHERLKEIYTGLKITL